MLPTICVACGESIKERAADNPNVCNACSCGVLAETEIELQSGAPRMRVSDQPHPPRRRSPAVGDHSHERKTFPALARRKHEPKSS